MLPAWIIEKQRKEQEAREEARRPALQIQPEYSEPPKWGQKPEMDEDEERGYTVVDTAI